MKNIIPALGAIAVFMVTACNGGGSSDDSNRLNPKTTDKTFTECQNPRPEACTQQYDPACGLRDTGVRCVTTPCPSSEWKTYGNSCTACSDPDVSGYWPGECEPVTSGDG